MRVSLLLFKNASHSHRAGKSNEHLQKGRIALSFRQSGQHKKDPWFFDPVGAQDWGF
jgi:hypothetical protein